MRWEKDYFSIGLNLWPFSSSPRGGVAHYALGLLREFGRICPERVVLIYGPHGEAILQRVDFPDRVRKICIRTADEMFAHRGRFDLLFTPAPWGFVNMSDRPMVHYLPDIQEQYYPHFFSTLERANRNYFYPYSAKCSTILVVPSQFTKRAVIEKFDVPQEKIRVIYHAAHAIFDDASIPGTRPSALADVNEPYLFYPANSWQHKNHRALLDALVILRDRCDLKPKCIFSGDLMEGDFNHVHIPLEIEKRGLSGQVRHIGKVGLHELKYLYSHALALIHPSLYEGFGLILLEAMLCRCPILAADRTSIPEIAEDAAVYFDPDDPADIAANIRHLMDNPNEAASRIEKARARALQFSERKQAQEYLGVFDDAYRLAGINSLKRSISSAAHEPYCTVILFMGSGVPQKVLEHTLLLAEDLGSHVQVVLATRAAKAVTVLLPPSAHTLEIGAESLRDAIGRVMELATGRYLFFSDGSNVLEPSFLYYLMAAARTAEPCADLLHGDTFFTDTQWRKITSTPVAGTNPDELKNYCCDNLAFVVTRDALRDYLTHSDASFGSLQDLAHNLYGSVSTTRLYRTVTIRCSGRRPLDHGAKNLCALIRDSYADRPLARRILNTRTAGFLLYHAVRGYSRMPLRLQLMVRSAYKKLASRLKGRVPVA